MKQASVSSSELGAIGMDKGITEDVDDSLQSSTAWQECNQCYSTEASFVHECGHLLCHTCDRSADSNVNANALVECPVCGVVGSFLYLGGAAALPESVERIFVPFINHLEDCLKVYRFQQTNLLRGHAHLKRQVKTLTALKGSLEDCLTQSNAKCSAQQTRIQRLEQEVMNVKQQLMSHQSRQPPFATPGSSPSSAHPHPGFASPTPIATPVIRSNHTAQNNFPKLSQISMLPNLQQSPVMPTRSAPSQINTNRDHGSIRSNTPTSASRLRYYPDQSSPQIRPPFNQSAMKRPFTSQGMYNAPPLQRPRTSSGFEQPHAHTSSFQSPSSTYRNYPGVSRSSVHQAGGPAFSDLNRSRPMTSQRPAQHHIHQGSFNYQSSQPSSASYLARPAPSLPTSRTHVNSPVAFTRTLPSRPSTAGGAKPFRPTFRKFQ